MIADALGEPAGRAGVHAAFDKWLTAQGAEGAKSLLQGTAERLGDEFGVFLSPSFCFPHPADVEAQGWPCEKRLVSAKTGQELFAYRWSLELLRDRLQRQGLCPPKPIPRPPPMMSESAWGARRWRRQRREKPQQVTLDVHLDLKSPYAYLAVEPVQRLRDAFEGACVRRGSRVRGPRCIVLALLAPCHSSHSCG